MRQSTIWKIKPGKRTMWKAWCDEIMSRLQEARGTLPEENVESEVCKIFGDGDGFVFIRQDVRGEKLPMNMERPINRKHKEMMAECLDPVTPEDGYAIFAPDKN